MSYEESKYFEDPHFLLTVEAADPDTGELVSVEVGYAYRIGRGRNQTIKQVLNPGDFERQLVFEASTIELVPFRRTIPTSIDQPRPDPVKTYQVKPTAALSR